MRSAGQPDSSRSDATSARPSFIEAMHRTLGGVDGWFHARVIADLKLARSFTILHLVGPLFGLILCAMLAVAAATPDWVVWVFGLGVSLFWAFPFLVRQSGQVEGPAVGSVQLLVLISLFLSYHCGGLNSPFAVWLVVATLLSFLFAGRLVGWCLTATAVQLAAFVVVSKTSPGPEYDAGSGWLFVASVTSATLYISFIAIFFALIKTEGSMLAAQAAAHRRHSARLHAEIAAATDDDRRRSAFLSRASHELRTLLNVVIGYSEMLLEDARNVEEVERQEHLRSVIESSRILLALIEDGATLAQANDSLLPGPSEVEGDPGGDVLAAGEAVSQAPTLATVGRWFSRVEIRVIPVAVLTMLSLVLLSIPGRGTIHLALTCIACAAALVSWVLIQSSLFGSERRGLAGQDELTGLRNRQNFQQELDRLIAARAGEPVALLFADLDGFKEVNDSLGHDAGDQLLARVAERFAATAPSGMLIGRLGGDEFGAVAFGERATDSVRLLADAWIDALNLPIETEQDFLSVGVSIGIAEGRAGTMGSRELLRRSDVAMYRAKADKRHPVQVFELQMDEALSFRKTMRQDLGIALREDQLQLVLQPVVNARGGELASAEALLRWTHPVLGAVSPAKLIPLAEESGQIIALDDWVLDRALQYACELPGVPIAVNVSPIHFRHPNLARKVVDRLQAYSVPARQLRLEITEGVLVTHTRAANRTILELREAGIGIAIDDFGTGFSSLSYLKDFQFDFLKIDRSFISDLGGGARTGSELLRAIVDLGHSLKMKVIAEGVENAGQASILQLLGCDYIQGYYTGRPMSFAQFLSLFADSDAGRRAAAR